LTEVVHGKQSVLGGEWQGKLERNREENRYRSMRGGTADSTLPVEANGSHVKLPGGICEKITWCAGKICYCGELVNPFGSTQEPHPRSIAGLRQNRLNVTSNQLF
jgi:hypothetical protein